MKRGEIPLLLAILLDLVGFGMAFPDLSIRLREMGLAQFAVGAVLASLFLTQIIASPRWGALSDRIGRKPVIIICTTLSALSMVVYAVSDSPWGVLVSRILGGLAAANVVVAQAYLADATTEKERSAAMGRIGAAVSIGLISGPFFGGLLADAGGSSLLGWVAASASGLGALMLLVGLPSAPPQENRRPGKLPIIDIRLLREVPEIRPLFALAVLAWFSLACLEGTFVPLLKSMFAFPVDFGPVAFASERSAGGTVFGFESLIAALIQGVALGYIASKTSTRLRLRLGFAFQGLGLLLTPFAPHLGFIFIFSALYSFGQSVANPTINAACSTLTPDNRQGEVFGLMQGARSVGFLLGPVIGGFLFDLDRAAPYVLAGVVGVAAALLVPATVNREASPTPTAPVPSSSG